MNTARVILIFGLIVLQPALALSQSGDFSVLSRDYEFTPNRAADTQYYIMNAGMTTYAANGEHTGSLTQTMFVTAEPAGDSPYDSYLYTCRKFAVIDGDTPEVTIAALENWQYFSTDTFVGIDDKQQIFGIDQSIFTNLTDNHGASVPTDMAYNIYTSFIDFHSFVTMYAEPSEWGAGIQDLTAIGQTVVFDASGIEAPLHFGDMFADGSYSQNGTMSLTFKGLSVVNETTCALMAYDTGEGSLTMIMEPVPDMTIETSGVFRNTGEIYRDLDTQCVRKAVGQSIILTEMFIPYTGETMNTVALRNTLVVNVSRERFKMEMAAHDENVTRIRSSSMPAKYALYANSPNPFNAGTTISYNLSERDNIRIDIFNVSGQRVKTLVDGTVGAGTHSVVWDGSDDEGAAVASGVYLYRLATPNTMLQQKMMLLK